MARQLEHQVMVRVPPELHKQVVSIASAEERTVSAWIRLAMKEKLARNSKKAAKK
jgi:predicted HicB family RNase H-like nuclease